MIDPNYDRDRELLRQYKKKTRGQGLALFIFSLGLLALSILLWLLASWLKQFMKGGI